MLNALVVDDDAATTEAVAELVQREGFATEVAGSLKDARAQMNRLPPDVMLIDLELPDGEGLDLVRELKESRPAVEAVVITGHASVDNAIKALRMGVTDYLTKPVDVARLKAILANVARTRELKAEISALRTELRDLGHFGPLLGGSPPMQKVYDLIARVAPTEATVLVMGDSGTGKDLVAQTVHAMSPRRKEPFLPLNCGAVAPNLIESELFGHERGSFTGADRLHKGYFERANKGTLFLDEITEMPIELQVKLLRVLETGTVMRIGAERGFQVDVRVIAATNRSPEEAVAQGKLREDLLYRLQVFPIQLPPLRERGSDIDLLVDHTLAELNKGEGIAKTLSPAARDRLRGYSWPGNVRELMNVIQRAFILADDELDPESLPLDMVGAAATDDGTGPMLRLRIGTSIADADRRLILATLEQCAADKKKTAEVLGISLKTLYNRLNSYNYKAH